MVFFAHSTSKEDRSDWQLLSEHLTSVAAQCADRARTFGAQDLAHVAGLLHDLGKYTDDFLVRIGRCIAKQPSRPYSRSLLPSRLGDTTSPRAS